MRFWVVCVIGLFVLVSCVCYWVFVLVGFYNVGLCVLLGCVLDCVCWWVVCAVGFCLL